MKPLRIYVGDWRQEEEKASLIKRLWQTGAELVESPNFADLIIFDELEVLFEKSASLPEKVPCIYTGSKGTPDEESLVQKNWARFSHFRTIPELIEVLALVTRHREIATRQH